MRTQVKGKRGRARGAAVLLGLAPMVNAAAVYAASSSARPPLALSAQGNASPPAGRWQDDPLWNDGKAEVSVYAASEPRYGAPREFKAFFIVVAEDLRRDTLVKADRPDPPGGTLRVLKLNQVIEFRTGIYTYSQMASVFVRLSDMQPVKETVTSHEWCGNTYLQLLIRDGIGAFRGFSYFDGEAERAETADMPNAHLYDALPLALRALPLHAGLARETTLVPRLLGNRLPTKIAPAAAAIAVFEGERVETGVGANEAWKVVVTHAGGEDRLWFEKAAPNRLLRWERAEGGRYVLERSRRLAYWTMHAAGDERALLENEVSDPPNPGPAR